MRNKENKSTARRDTVDLKILFLLFLMNPVNFCKKPQLHKNKKKFEHLKEFIELLKFINHTGDIFF